MAGDSAAIYSFFCHISGLGSSEAGESHVKRVTSSGADVGTRGVIGTRQPTKCRCGGGLTCLRYFQTQRVAVAKEDPCAIKADELAGRCSVFRAAIAAYAPLLTDCQEE